MQFFYVFVAINGFLSIAFEILAMRLFAPFFGAGTEQSSYIIGTVLLFYSLGNFYSHKNTADHKTVFKRNIFIAAVFHGVILCHPVLYWMREAFVFIGIKSFYMQMAVMCLLTLAPLSFIYGQNLPMLLESSPVKKSNYVLGFGTIGSFMGSVLTALLLVYWLPASQMTLLTLGCVLVQATLMIEHRKLVFLAPVVAISVYLNNVVIQRMVNWETGVANYNMDEKGDFRGLIINGTKYSSLIIGKDSSGPYNDLIHREFLDDKTAKNVLVLGAGGFSLSTKNKHHRYTYIDVDPKIKDIVSRKFNPDPVGVFVYSDARAFLINNKDKYDLIVQDVFDGDPEIPPHLLTMEHFRSIRDRLTPDGYFGMNIPHTGSLLKSPDASRVTSTIQSVFNNCYYVPVWGPKLYEASDKIRQTFAICQNLVSRTRPVTDDHY